MTKVKAVRTSDQQSIARRKCLSAIMESYPNAVLVFERLVGTRYTTCWQDSTTDTLLTTLSENIFDDCKPIYVDVYSGTGKGYMTYLVDVPSSVA